MCKRRGPILAAVYAIITEITARPAVAADATAQRETEEFLLLRASRPGFKGHVVVDAGGGRTIVLVLWDSAAAATAARQALEPVAARLWGDLWASPPRVLGAGKVRHLTPLSG